MIHYMWWKTLKIVETCRNVIQVCSSAIETPVIASSTPLPPKLLVAGLICHRHFVVSQSATKKAVIHLRIAALPPPTDLPKGSEWFIINTQTDLRPEMHKKNIKMYVSQFSIAIYNRFRHPPASSLMVATPESMKVRDSHFHPFSLMWEARMAQGQSI